MKMVTENEKGVTVGGVNNGGLKEEEKKNHGGSGRGPVGRHLSTKAEAEEYLADLSGYPGLANWLAGDAREKEARRIRRTGKKKRKGPESQMVGDGKRIGVLGTDEVLAPENWVAQIGAADGAQGSNHLQIDAVLESEDAGAQQHKVDDTGKEDIGNISSFGQRTEPTGHGNIHVESSSFIGLCFSYSEEVEVTIDATTEEAKMNGEKDDFIDITGKGEQADNDADVEGMVSSETEAADRKDIIPVKLLRNQAAKNADFERRVSLEAHPANRKMLKGEQADNDADVERTVSLETQPADRKHIIPVKLLRNQAAKNADFERRVSLEAHPANRKMLKGEQADNDADVERMVSLETQPADRKDIIPVKLLGNQAVKNADFERTVSLEAQTANRKRTPRYSG